MPQRASSRIRTSFAWLALSIAIVAPIVGAVTSPLLAWRDPIYIIAGIAGVIGFVLLLLQPMLIGGYLPGVARQNSRRIHRWIGSALVISVVIHVAALWLTSPPDVVDALLFSSPTLFSAWGVIAMWAAFAAAFVAAMRNRLKLHPSSWRRMHVFLTMVVVVGTIVHALLIEGTMEPNSKALLCVFVGIATLKVLFDLKAWNLWRFSGD